MELNEIRAIGGFNWNKQLIVKLAKVKIGWGKNNKAALTIYSFPGVLRKDLSFLI